MSTSLIIAVLSGLYAIFGNIFVYLVLVDRKVTVSFMRAGTPFYLYSVCGRETEKAGTSLLRFALSSDIAYLIALVGVLFHAGGQNH